MKPIKSILELLELCIAIDSKMAAMYHYFSKNEKDSGMKNFWNLMSEDEKAHVRSWQILSDLALNRIIFRKE